MVFTSRSRLGSNYYQRRLLIQKQKSSGVGTLRNSWRDTDSDEDDDECSVSLSSIDTNSVATDSESIKYDENLQQEFDVKQHSNNKKITNRPITIIIPSSKSTPESLSSPLEESFDDDGQPATPWGKSTAKSRIIDELMNSTSDIYLFIGKYTATNFDNVNFKALLQNYAGNKYKPSAFRENMKRLLKHLQNKTGPFKRFVEGQLKAVEPWYTSVNNVSNAYSLLLSLLMDDAGARALDRMSIEQIWKSDPLFQQYELDKFKEYHKNMVKLTGKRKKLLSDEYRSYLADMKKVPRHNTTARGYPFWDTHKASKLLEEDEESGQAKTLMPKDLWKSRKEYQDFPLDVFRKHIYQLRSKRLAAPYWQYKRNINAKKKFEDAERMMKEWHDD